MEFDAMMQPLRDSWQPVGVHYEYRVLTLEPPTTTRDTRRLLTEAAEYGRWELARSMLFPGGRRKIWLRRKTIRVRSTL